MTRKENEPGPINDDQLTAKYTAFRTMQEMLNAKGGYSPSLRTQSAATYQERIELGLLADAYDAYQGARGDPRRATRS